MKRIKTFKEHFDTEELKANFEIDYLTGRFHDILKGYVNDVKRIGPGSKNETIENFVGKIASVSFPFFRAFFAKDETNFKSIETDVKYDDDEKYYIFIVKDKSNAVAFGLRINSLNDYDVYFYIYDKKGDYGDGYSYEHQNYNQVVSLIRNYYIPVIVDNDLGELLEFRKEDNPIINN